MAIVKAQGGGFYVKLTFEHRGVGGSYDVGFGLAPHSAVGFHDVAYWWSLPISVSLDNVWTLYTVEFSESIPLDMPSGLKDVLKWVQTRDGPRDPGGNGFVLADWDEDIFEIIQGTEFRNLDAVSYT